jgi:hypothetical protein
MKPDPLQSLLAAARRAAPTASADLAAPPGFATRVVAHAFAARPRADQGEVTFAFRFFGAACALALALAAWNYTATAAEHSADQAYAFDPVGEVLAAYTTDS